MVIVDELAHFDWLNGDEATINTLKMFDHLRQKHARYNTVVIVGEVAHLDCLNWHEVIINML